MQNHAYIAFLSLELFRDALALYFHKRFKESFELIQKPKTMKFEAEWDKS